MITLLTSKNILTTKAFYQSLGLQLTEEKHGDAPTHFSINLKTTLFEIYPHSPTSTSHTIFMLDVSNLQTCLTQIPILGGKILEPISEKNNSLRLLAQDPDGRTLRLTQMTPEIHEDFYLSKLGDSLYTQHSQTHSHTNAWK